ncbi:undecaprenyl-diphosphate phosphatase [Fictibacillus arsenicus]|uniref:Undecaprenyl-diphosphatase n=1 Tax=Fictibacillus arsenicus TaxID=255247 RepID=A0A1V3G901_9BACL|nr:undecaprenyl-diphosphate phosphatase [Fictibacillus arsenicus]OOE12890.1 undecaprenyl-diphosphatase [Fictibacillus arsenicus]
MFLWVAIVMGIIEGITEFLPVSSTGHLIVAGHMLDFTGDKAKTFEIVIQLGSILAVVVLYWNRLWSLLGVGKMSKKENSLNLGHIFIAIMPAVIIGLLVHDFIKAHLFSPKTVIVGLVIGGFLMLFAEKVQNKKGVNASDLDDMTYKQALKIGLFQCLSLWPGFSRSGATISGGLISGLNHRTAADFSFIQAVPIMIAASGLDLYKSRDILSAADLPFFLTGFVTAFLVAAVAILFFVKLIAKVKLTPFAYYRFIVAAILAVFFYL